VLANAGFKVVNLSCFNEKAVKVVKHFMINVGAKAALTAYRLKSLVA